MQENIASLLGGGQVRERRNAGRRLRRTAILAGLRGRRLQPARLPKKPQNQFSTYFSIIRHRRAMSAVHRRPSRRTATRRSSCSPPPAANSGGQGMIPTSRLPSLLGMTKEKGGEPTQKDSRAALGMTKEADSSLRGGFSFHRVEATFRPEACARQTRKNALLTKRRRPSACAEGRRHRSSIGSSRYRRPSLASMHSVAWGTFIRRSLGMSRPVVLHMP